MVTGCSSDGGEYLIEGYIASDSSNLYEDTDSEIAKLTNHLSNDEEYDDNSYNFILSPEELAEIQKRLENTRLPVLLYHHLLPDDLNTNHRYNAAVISLEAFEEQMAYLYTNGFTTITISQLEDFLLHQIPLPERSVMIHFDDGYYSNFVYAMPVLERYNFIAQLFLIGKAVYDRGDTQPPMNHEGLTFTAAITIEDTEHVFETANHTFAKHHTVSGTPYTAFVYYDIETVEADMIRGFDFVNDHRAFAYPQGQYSSETIQMLTNLGVTQAFTTQKGYVTIYSNNMLLPRFIIFPTTTLEDFSRIVNGLDE